MCGSTKYGTTNDTMISYLVAYLVRYLVPHLESVKQPRRPQRLVPQLAYDRSFCAGTDDFVFGS